MFLPEIEPGYLHRKTNDRTIKYWEFSITVIIIGTLLMLGFFFVPITDSLIIMPIIGALIFMWGLLELIRYYRYEKIRKLNNSKYK